MVNQIKRVMKELSTKEKAKAYDEAVRKVMDYREGKTKLYSDVDKTLDYLFPELKESDDEKIRKELISLVTWSTSYSASGVTKEDADNLIAWLEKQGDANKEYWRGYREGKQEILDKYAELEKQGEQKPYGQRKECTDCQFNYAGECLGYCNMKRSEQKPAWSEEDEDIINKILCICYDFKRSFEISPVSTKVIKEDVDKIDSWLKSLRPQNTWKPSDEQMKALRRMKAAIAGEGEIYEPLNSLYEDLKKLRNE